jgi:hypothetical protein
MTLLVIASVLLGSATWSAHQASVDSPSGALPQLGAETFDQAKACGRRGADCAVTPYELCRSERQRYIVKLATPFSRVASSVFEGLASGRSGRGMDRANANRWGTGIYVLPTEGSTDAAGIERLEIRRDSLNIEPRTVTVGPVTVRMPDGRSKQLARGYFSFAPEVFAPTASITLVLKGTAGEITCLVDRTRLLAIR